MSYEKELEKQNEELQRKLAIVEGEALPWLPVWISPRDCEWHYTCKRITFGRINKVPAKSEEGSPTYIVEILAPIGQANPVHWQPYLTLDAAKAFIERGFVNGNYILLPRNDDDEY